MGRGDEEVCFDGVLGADMDFTWTFFSLVFMYASLVLVFFQAQKWRT
jgi:hypothetical protein